MGKYIYQAILTPDEDGGYTVEVPDLDGCFTEGDTYQEAAFMAADAMKTYVASLVKNGDTVPDPTKSDCPEGSESISIFFETDADYIVDGPVVFAAQAARELGVSPGRVSHMIESGILEGYRRGRNTMVTISSIERRKSQDVHAGRPRKAEMG